ncbi:MAG: hypothetical protein LDL31_00065 [Prosthecobacter sp.]|jgi:hypothetical protein|nr:hypothetical protein [Prosthecobacter sp.]
MRLSLLQRLIYCIVLTAYAVTGTAVMPALMAIAAGIEGSHQVAVTETGHGVHLAMRHLKGSFTPAVSDHPSQTARLLVSLCKSTEQGDHLLCSEQFSAIANQNESQNQRITRAEPQESNLCLWLHVDPVLCIARELHQSLANRTRNVCLTRCEEPYLDSRVQLLI